MKPATSVNGAKAATGQFDMAAVRALDVSSAGLTSLAKVESIIAAAGAASRPLVAGLDADGAAAGGVAAFTGVTRLNASSNALTSLDGVELLKNLRYLNASNNALTSIAALASLTELEEVKLAGNGGLDARATAATLAKLPALRSVWIDEPLSSSEATGHGGASVCLTPLAQALLTSVPQLELVNGLEVAAWKAMAEAVTATQQAGKTTATAAALLASGTAGPASVFSSLPPVARLSESATIAGSAGFASGFVAVKAALRTADSSISAAGAEAAR